MKKHSLSFLILPFVLLFAFFGCTKTTDETEKSLSFTISETDYSSFKRVTDLFLEEHPDYTIHFTIRKSSHLSYYLAHDRIDTDFVIIDDLVQLNLHGDVLLDITNSEALQNYNSYIFNFIKDRDGRVLAMPSPGKAFCYCVNMDLFEKHNLQVPSTIGELKEFTAHLSSNIFPVVSSFSDSQTYLDYLMQTTVPSFFSTAKGLAFFNDYIFSRKHLRESDSYETFQEVLNNFSYLTNKENFTIPNQEDAISAFLDQKAFILSVNPDLDLKKAYEEKGASFRYEMRPFLGRQQSDQWVCSLPDFYLSCIKENYTKKKKEINTFFSFFSGKQAQEEMRRDADGNIIENSFSFNSLSEDMMNGAYEELNSVISHGRIFLLDEFLYAFRLSYPEISDFANSMISKSDLIDNLDETMFASNNYEKRSYYIPEFDCPNLSEEDRRKKIQAKIATDLKRILSMDMLALPESYLKEDIFEGLLFNSELDIVFDSSAILYPYEMKGSQLKDYLSADYDTLNKETTLSGIRKEGNSFVFNNLQSINPQAVYLIALPYDLPEGSYVRKGNPISILDEYHDYIDSEYKK